MTGEELPTMMDGVPMTVDKMCQYLQDYFGKPTALRKQGELDYQCPYCQGVHQSEFAGHVNVECEDESRFNGIWISIGDRTFTAGYGVTVFEYIEDDKGSRLILVWVW